MIFGIQILPSILAVRKEVRRVPGGHLNRWLIRAEVMVPCAIHDRASNRIYVHPSLLDAMQRAGQS